MINFEVKGAIFDVDDTLLDNKPGIPGQGLHEQSRLAAAHKVGRKYNITRLMQLSVQENLDAFLNAPVHTLEAAVWNILVMTGEAHGEIMNLEHPLLQEIVALKNALHEEILMTKGEEVSGAGAFVYGLAKHGLEDKLAIASTAVRRDVDLFLGKTGLSALFPPERIRTKEDIAYPKPNPEVFNLAFASLKLPESDRKNVCAFEDDPRGIMAAKAAGLFTCAITTRFSRDELEALEVAPDLVGESYEEFSELFGLTS